MWNPDPRLRYRGRYPAFELMKARQVLIGALSDTSSTVLERLKPRIGIPSRYGNAVPLLPPVQPPTWGLGSRSESASQSTDEVPLKKRKLSHSSATSTVTNAECSNTSNEGSNESDAAENVANDIIDLTNDSANDTISVDTDADVSKSTDTSDVSNAATSFFVGEVADEIATEKLMDKYKCDFCQFTSDTTNEMQKHLQDETHFSASMYKVRQNAENGIDFVYVVKKLAVKNKFAKDKALVVVCPKCNDIFEDIFMCGLHYKNTHGSRDGLYAVCPVIFQNAAVIHISPSCDFCKVMFGSFRELHEHWKNLPSHHPITRTLPNTAFALFLCPFCNMRFFNNFHGCKSHIINHTTNWPGKQAVCSMTVRYVQKPVKSEKLVPFKEDLQGGDGLQEHLNTLRNMKKHFKNVGGNKHKRKNIASEIKQLKQMYNVQH